MGVKFIQLVWFPNFSLYCLDWFVGDFFDARNGICTTAMKEGLLGLPSKLDVFVSHDLGVDLKLEGGQNHPAGKNRSVIWTATFGSVEDYESYDTSEEHVSVVSNLIKPIIVPGSRSAIQYMPEE